jgi:hypothetical protein
LVPFARGSFSGSANFRSSIAAASHPIAGGPSPGLRTKQHTKPCRALRRTVSDRFLSNPIVSCGTHVRTRGPSSTTGTLEHNGYTWRPAYGCH